MLEVVYNEGKSIKLMIFRKNQHINYESGVTAIFIVIFFALLIGVITLSFMHIATQDQRQSTNSDLSQSAYDSSEAGIEDATRVLQNYRRLCVNLPTGTPKPARCATYETELQRGVSGECNLQSMPELSSKADPATGEVSVSTNASDKELDQAYTCVKLITQTNDIMQTAQGDKNYLFPLKTVNNEPISKININWFADNQDLVPPATIGYYAGRPKLPLSSNWPSNAPPILRVQLIAAKRGAINVNDLDNDSRAVFLYPASSGSNQVDMTIADFASRGKKSQAPTTIGCNKVGIFNCSAVLANLLPATGADASTTDYYLRFTPLYRSTTDIQVVLNNASGSVIKFDGVEPAVDSTGRANDVFRRLQQRIKYESDNSILGKDGGFDITNGMCKDFIISNKDADYVDNC